MDIKILSLADTVGKATPEQISFALQTLIPKYPDATIGVHLHSTESNWLEKLKAAVNAGCIRIDGAINGIGGCPMAQDELIGNMKTENIIEYLQEKNMIKNLNEEALSKSIKLAEEIFI
jgi:hydroxymethylglutaryl-CoA lyase